ncbi:hypothetical protein [Paenibacillus rhizolycopersici]|uniref:hypothetical protein n=1 Tax=Paenibacillus rhizolycopersici TaxID=2780073 RepID=UPI003D2B754E
MKKGLSSGAYVLVREQRKTWMNSRFDAESSSKASHRDPKFIFEQPSKSSSKIGFEAPRRLDEEGAEQRSVRFGT